MKVESVLPSGIISEFYPTGNESDDHNDDNSKESWDWLNCQALEIIQRFYGYEPNLYRDVLNVEHYASARVIRTAYFRRGREILSGENSPIKNIVAGSLNKDSDLSFQAISAAYEVLSHPQRRERYDAYLHQKETRSITMGLTPIIRRRGTAPLSLVKHREKLNNPHATIRVSWNEEVEELIINDYDPLEHSHRHKAFNKAARAASMGEYKCSEELGSNGGGTDDDNFTFNETDIESIERQSDLCLQLIKQLRELDEEAEDDYGRDFFDKVEDGFMELVSLASSTKPYNSSSRESDQNTTDEMKQRNSKNTRNEGEAYSDSDGKPAMTDIPFDEQHGADSNGKLAKTDIPFDEQHDQQKERAPEQLSSSVNPIDDEEPGHIYSNAKVQYIYNADADETQRQQHPQTLKSPGSPVSVAMRPDISHDIQKPWNIEELQEQKEMSNNMNREVQFSEKEKEAKEVKQGKEEISFTKEGDDKDETSVGMSEEEMGDDDSFTEEGDDKDETSVEVSEEEMGDDDSFTEEGDDKDETSVGMSKEEMGDDDGEASEEEDVKEQKEDEVGNHEHNGISNHYPDQECKQTTRYVMAGDDFADDECTTANEGALDNKETSFTGVISDGDESLYSLSSERGGSLKSQRLVRSNSNSRYENEDESVGEESLDYSVSILGSDRGGTMMFHCFDRNGLVKKGEKEGENKVDDEEDDENALFDMRESQRNLINNSTSCVPVAKCGERALENVEDDKGDIKTFSTQMGDVLERITDFFSEMACSDFDLMDCNILGEGGGEDDQIEMVWKENGPKKQIAIESGWRDASVTTCSTESSDEETKNPSAIWINDKKVLV